MDPTRENASGQDDDWFEESDGDPWNGVVLDGRPLSAEEIRLLQSGESAKVWVSRMPPGETSLDFLERAAPFLKEFSLTDRNCADASVIAGMEQVERIYLSKLPKKDIDFTRLRRLRKFNGPGTEHLLSLAGVTSLCELELDTPREAFLSAIEADLEVLDLRQARTLRGLARNEHFAGLREISIHGSPRFDCSTLLQIDRPSYVQLHTIKDLVNIEALAAWGSGPEIELHNCGPLAEPVRILALADARLSLIGDRFPIDRQFVAERLQPAPSLWSLPPALL